MGKKNALLAAGLLIVGLAVVPLASQTGNQWDKQLRAAIDKEVMDGDLKGAIEQYKKIIAARGASRAVVAKAMLQLGGCFEKQGSAEARKTFEQLVKDYADQTDIVAQARARLAALAPLSGVKSAGAGLRTRQVWTGKDADPWASPSLDGRLLAFIDDENDLLVRDLNTGVNRRLANLAKSASREGAESPRWCPDGKRIAYHWIGPAGDGELRVYDVQTGTSRTLFAEEGRYLLDLGAWSRDGKFLPVVLMGKGAALGLVSVESGEFRALKINHDPYSVRHLDLSPDGSLLAYDAPQPKVANSSDICAVEVASGRQFPIMEHPALDYLLGWSSDGHYILFQSDRSGTPDIWGVRVDRDGVSSPPELIKQETKWINGMGFTSNGTFYYAARLGGSDIYETEVDFTSGRAAEPRKISKSREGLNFKCEFSPDGRYLAYQTIVGTMNPFPRNLYGAFPTSHSSNAICVYSLDDGTTRDYITSLEISNTMPYHVRWSSDGKDMVFLAQDSKDRRSALYKLDVKSGEISKIMDDSPYAWSANGKTLFFTVLNKSEKIWRLVSRDPVTGAEKELYRYGQKTGNQFPMGLSLSPDERLVAFQTLGTTPGGGETKLVIVSVADGTVRTLLTGLGRFSLGWSSDSRSMLLSKRIANSDRCELWQVPISGETPKKIDFGVNYPSSITAHPDGKRIAFELQVPTSYQIWAMENFLPPAKDAKQSK